MKIYLPTIIIVILDQITKQWILLNFNLYESIDIFGSYVRFIHVKNPGLAFGIPVGEFGQILTIISLIATLFIAYYHWMEKNNHPLISSSLGFILGGAIGNMSDRIKIFFVDDYKGVVDFIDIGFLQNRWYTFNIADVGVTIGIILYLIHSLLIYKPSLIEKRK